MPKAYVGIAGPNGLTILQPERDETLLAIERFVGRGRRVGFWALLGDDDARSVQTLIRQGYWREALRALERCAQDFGRILPFEPERFDLH